MDKEIKVLFCNKCKKETEHEITDVRGKDRYEDAKEHIYSKYLECNCKVESYSIGGKN